MTKIILKILIVVIILFQYICAAAAVEDIRLSQKAIEIDPLSYGAKGDGVTDDTESLQRAFNVCSRKGLICKIPGGRNFLVTSPLFLWGQASIEGDKTKGIITFNVKSSPYLLNIGISGRKKLAEPFSGNISGVHFKVIGGNEGRIIFFWRTDGAQILNNTFDVGRYAYSATSSGNDNNWVVNGFQNLIRKNISIIGNKIVASSNDSGSEGIGLGNFDGALISGNTIIGVGDDPIGIHFCKNIKILNNELKSVDGRLFVVNSSNVEIAYNNIERMRSLKDNKFYTGISLLYVGFETLNKNEFSAPTNIDIHNNYLYYPPGAIDQGAAIYLYGTREAVVKLNSVVNDSATVTATALHLLPATFTGLWRDPDHVDHSNIARVRDVVITNNVSKGKYPLEMIMSGNCIDYDGRINVNNNTASGFKFYCNKVDIKSNFSY
ncbi:MAG: hypothetical protein V4528_04925 [Pseudomonadota bacterium]